MPAMPPNPPLPPLSAIALPQHKALTLAQCAAECGVSTEVVRQWCIRWRLGQSGGLPYWHGGAKPEAESARVEYRIDRDDWDSFKRERRRQERRSEASVRRWVEAPIGYV